MSWVLLGYFGPTAVTRLPGQRAVTVGTSEHVSGLEQEAEDTRETSEVISREEVEESTITLT